MKKTLILFALGVLLVIPAITLLFTVAPRWVLGAYVQCCGAEVEGVVTNKRESVEFYYENWRHRTEVSVRYRPRAAGADETFTHAVDPVLFDRLEIGAPVRVRYAPSAWLRRATNGAGLASASLASREVHATGFWGNVLNELFVSGTATLFVLSFFFRNVRARWAGLVGLSGSLAGSMMSGFLVFPVLFVLWRKLRGFGFGRALLLAIALAVVVMAVNVPWPDPASPGPSTETTATVVQVKTVDRIWGALMGHTRVGLGTSARTGWPAHNPNAGTSIDAPFLLVDLEFTPPGATRPVHAVDRVDASSAPGVTAGAQVRVVVPQADPRAARIAGAQRDYARDALVHLLAWTGGMSLFLLPILWPIVALGVSIARRGGYLPPAAKPSAAEPAASA